MKIIRLSIGILGLCIVYSCSETPKEIYTKGEEKQFIEMYYQSYNINKEPNNENFFIIKSENLFHVKDIKNNTDFEIILKQDSMGFYIKKDENLYLTHAYDRSDEIENTSGTIYPPLINNYTQLRGIKTYQSNGNKYKVYKFYEDFGLNSHSLKVSYYLENFGLLIMTKYYSKTYLKIDSISNGKNYNLNEIKIVMGKILSDSLFFETENLTPPVTIKK
jgi:hypothetical protein